MKKFLMTTTVISCLIFLPSAVWADDRDLDDLLGMSLEELTVSAVSKRNESISDAPGIVNVISAEEISRYGARNIQDILQRVPGLHMFGVFSLPESAVSIRGQQSTGANQHVLVTIDERPLRDYLLGGGYDVQTFNNFPIEAIDYIEVIRGPGSVLYGSNAFSGIINIVSKKAKGAEGEWSTAVKGRYGSNEYVSSEFYTSTKGADYDLVFAGRVQDERGFKQGETSDILGNRDPGAERSQEGFGGFVRAQYKNLNLTAFRADEKPQAFGNTPIFPFYEFKKTADFINLGYVHGLGAGWDAHLNLTYNAIDVLVTDGAANAHSKSGLVEGYVTGTVFDSMNIVAGATYNQLDGTDRITGIKDDQVWKSAYLQTDYRPFDPLKLIAGLQLNDPERSKVDLSPRLGAIYDITDRIGVKYLYGEAFRSPSFFEQNFAIAGVISGNSGLEPEKIATQDLQLFYESPKYFGAITFFKSRLENTIFVDPALLTSIGGTPTPTFNNGNNLTSEGIELEGRAQLSAKWNIQGSFSYQTNETAAGVKDTQISPNTMVKAGVNYNSLDGINVGVFNTYFTSYPISNTAPKRNPDSFPYNHLTANVTFDIPQLLDMEHKLPAMQFSIYGDNLLESDIIYAPDGFGPGLVNTLPQRAGRTVYAQLRVQF